MRRRACSGVNNSERTSSIRRPVDTSMPFDALITWTSGASSAAMSSKNQRHELGRDHRYQNLLPRHGLRKVRGGPQGLGKGHPWQEGPVLPVIQDVPDHLGLPAPDRDLMALSGQEPGQGGAPASCADDADGTSSGGHGVPFFFPNRFSSPFRSRRMLDR